MYRTLVKIVWMAAALLESSLGIGQSYSDLFQRSTEKSDVACYRIPALAVTKAGTWLAAADQRPGTCQDLGKNPDINIVLRRSNNQGRTWLPMETAVDLPAGLSVSDPSFLVDEPSGQIFLFFNFMDHLHAPGTYRLQFVSSTDDGSTWSNPVDFTDMVLPEAERKEFVFITSGNGTRTQNGTLLHTIVNVTRKHTRVIFSNDHGMTWKSAPTPVTPADESRIIELPDGSWMVNARVNNLGKRFIHRSTNMGKSWSSAADSLLIDPGCNAGLISVKTGKSNQEKTWMIFSNPFSPNARKDLTLHVSDDHGATWKTWQSVQSGSAAYSVLAADKRGRIGVLYECDDYSTIRIRFFEKREIPAILKGKNKKR